MASIEQFDLAGAAYGGLINEDVMQKIWDISNIPLPLTDRIGTDTHGNAFCEWTVDALQAPSLTNAQVDSATLTSVADENLGSRKGNHTTTSVKVVKVGDIANASDTIGFANALSYQLMQRQRELKRDIEAQMLSNQASVKEAAGVAGRSAGLDAWITNKGDTVTTNGGWQSGTGLVSARVNDTDAADAALTEAHLKAAVKLAYEDGGEPSILMTTPTEVDRISTYLFAATSIAALQSDVREKESGVTATGAVRLWVTNFANLEIVPNRLQQIVGTSTCVDVFLLDPTYLRLSYLQGITTEPLAKTGLFTQMSMRTSWSLKVLNEDAQAIVAGVDSTAAVTA